MVTTFAGMSILSLRKSTTRYIRLWPPPRCQIVRCPLLFRPPQRVLGSSRLLSGFVSVISSNVATVMNRRPGDVGANCRIPIKPSGPLEVLDHLLAFGQGHVGLLPVGAASGVTPHALPLAMAVESAHLGHLDLEE